MKPWVCENSIQRRVERLAHLHGIRPVHSRRIGGIEDNRYPRAAVPYRHSPLQKRDDWAAKIPAICYLRQSPSAVLRELFDIPVNYAIAARPKRSVEFTLKLRCFDTGVDIRKRLDHARQHVEEFGWGSLGRHFSALLGDRLDPV